MNIREIQEFTPGSHYYSLKDKVYDHVMLRVFQACDEAETIRKQINTPEAFTAWQQRIKNTFKACIGEVPYDKQYPLNVIVAGIIEEESLTVEKVIFTAREGVYVTANVYVPRHHEAKSPAVLLQCGHTLNGKAAEAYQQAARMIAGKGIIVLVQDPPGQGERSYYKEAGDKEARIAGATQEHQQFGNQCFLADAMRGLAYLRSRPDVDPDRIRATGNSGGGTMTAVTMLVDERIKAAAPSCWPTSDKEYFVQGMAPDTEQIWLNVWKEHLGHCEIMASMCPKPLLLLAQEGDFVPIEGTDKLYKECRRLWKLNGAQANMQMHMAEGKHGFSESNAKAAAEFFAKCFGTRADDNAADVTLLPEQTLYCTESGRIMEDIPDSLTVFEENLREYQSISANRGSEDQRREALRDKVYGSRKPVENIHVRKLYSVSSDGLLADTHVCDGGLLANMHLWFAQEMLPCYGVRFRNTEYAQGDLPMTICLWQGGTDSLEVHFAQIKALCDAGRQVLVLDVTAMGKCAPNRTLSARDPLEHHGSISDKLSKALFSLGDSLCAIQVFDLMWAIEITREKFGAKEVELLTEGNYAILARMAGLLDQRISVTAIDEISVKDIVRNKYYENYDIAHILLPGLVTYLDGII